MLQATWMRLDERWYAMGELIAYLGVARDTSYRRIARGGSPAHGIGNLRKFNLSEADDLVRLGSVLAPEGEPR